MRIQDWGLILISGKDALAFLNRTCSQLITEQTVKEGCLAHFLTPTGKIIHTFGLIEDKTGKLYMETHLGAYESFLREIGKLIFSEDISFNKISSFYLTSSKSKDTFCSAFFKDIPLYYSYTRPEKTLTEGELQTLRLEKKIPIFPLDYSQDFFAIETDVIQGISFDKGCYPGQEVVSKTVFRGKSPALLYWFDSPLDTITQVADTTRGRIVSMYKRDEKTYYGFIRLPSSADIDQLSKQYSIRITRHGLFNPLP